MRGSFFLLALAVLLAVASLSSAKRCPVSTCSPNDPNLPLVWLNTSTIASYVHGLAFRVYARMPSGKAYAQAYSQINITNIREQAPTDGTDICDKADVVPETIRGNYVVLGELDWSQMCCAASTTWDMVNGNVNRSTATISVTWPEHPDFIAKFHMYLVNETISKHVEGTPNTLGLDYDVVYSNVSQKLTFEMSNWPWLSKNTTLNPDGIPSYIKFFLTATASLDEPGQIGYANKVTSINYNASTPKTFLSLDFLKIVTLDDVDYAMSQHADGGDDFLQGPIEFFSPPAVLVACRAGRLISNPYWQNLSYDPTLIAVFSGEEFTPGNNRHARLNPAAYIVPIVVVAALLVVAALIIFVPSINNKVFKRQTISSLPTLEDHHATRSTANASSGSSAPAPATKGEGKRNSSWVRSKTVDHDE